MSAHSSWDEFVRLDDEREATRRARRESEERARREMDDIDAAKRPSEPDPPPVPREPRRGRRARWLTALALGASYVLVVVLVLLIGPSDSEPERVLPRTSGSARLVEREAILQAARIYSAGENPEVECRVITPAHSARITGEETFSGCVRRWADWVAAPLRGVRVSALRGDRARVSGVYSDGSDARYGLRRIRGRWLVDTQEGGP